MTKVFDSVFWLNTYVLLENAILFISGILHLNRKKKDQGQDYVMIIKNTLMIQNIISSIARE